MEPFSLKNDSFFIIEEWCRMNENLIAGFTTKNGGVSENDFTSLNLGFHVHDSKQSVLHNREHLSFLLDFPLNRWVGAQQTHQVHVAKVKHEHQGLGAYLYENSLPSTDGLYTNEQGILLTMCFADCVPIFFLDPKKKAIGLVHAGWKGTVHLIVERMVQVFQNENICAEDIHVVIGPSICENCYIVDQNVIDLVKNTLEDVEEKPYNLINGNQYYLNLKELNRQLLIKAGVLDKNIQVTNLCSSCAKDTFFSYRRDGGSTGRMMGFIGWKGAL